MKQTAARRRLQRGLSLVELMVGLAIGLFIVAAATLLITTQLGDNRKLLLETQVQQDLRASADIITRELRRAGFWSRAETGVWTPSTGAAARNIYLQATPAAGSDDVVGFTYRRLDGAAGPFGFKLEGGAIKTLLSGSGWQELTDKNVLIVDEFTVAADPDPWVSVRLPCPNACPLPPPAGQTADYCWPTLAVRGFTVTIRGHAVSDPSITRTVQSRIRLRNDALQFNAGPVADPQSCPS